MSKMHGDIIVFMYNRIYVQNSGLCTKIQRVRGFHFSGEEKQVVGSVILAVSCRKTQQSRIR